jgi:homoserine kinase
MPSPALTSAPVTIRVPGTTSNLGSGFDTLGLALKLYNRVRVTPVGRRGVQITSPVAPEALAGATAMVAESAALFFRRTRTKAFGFEIHIEGDVPVARGLGSSTTVQLGCVAALNVLSGAKLDRQVLFEMVSELEGHPDNAAPATFGGFAVAGPVGDSVRVLRFAVPAAARFVTLIPRFEVRTSEARRLLPTEYSKADLIHSLNRVALITGAFASGELESLRGLFDDRVHQPYRAPLIPGLDRVIAAGVKAGALGGWLSGSGSTVMCLTLAHPERVAAAMQAELPDSDIRVLAGDRQGVLVEN